MYKKNLKLLLPLTLSLSIIPIFTQSCFNSHENNSNDDEVISNINKDPISTKIPDIANFSISELRIEISKIENKLRETIEYSNLKQWNEHYAASTDKKTRTKIWEPGPGKSNVYNEQNDQFQYFNDFLHTNNNISGTPSPNQKDQRSFLFERAYLFYLKAVYEWKTHPMYNEATFVKINAAIAQIPLGNPKELGKISETIVNWIWNCRWYKKSKTIFNDLGQRFVKNSKPDKDWDKYNDSYEAIKIRYQNFEGEIISRMFPSLFVVDDSTPIPGPDAIFKMLEDFIRPFMKAIPSMKVDEEDFYKKPI